MIFDAPAPPPAPEHLWSARKARFLMRGAMVNNQCSIFNIQCSMFNGQWSTVNNQCFNVQWSTVNGQRSYHSSSHTFLFSFTSNSSPGTGAALGFVVISGLDTASGLTAESPTTSASGYIYGFFIFVIELIFNSQELNSSS